ncbi:MAG: hypothetical protein WB988_11370 [Candidatus Nitrosopolaris sp.]
MIAHIVSPHGHHPLPLLLTDVGGSGCPSIALFLNDGCALQSRFAGG